MWRDTPTEFRELSLTLDPEGKFIICGVCQKHDVRRNNQKGIVTCTRQRFFKFDSFKEHVKTDYHEASVRCRDRLIDSKAVLNRDMTKKQYESKHKCRWERPKKKQKITSFFKPVVKDSNTTPAIEKRSANGVSDAVSPNAQSNSTAGNDVVAERVLDVETVSPPAEISPILACSRRHDAREYSRFCTQNRLIYGQCHGAVSSFDLTNYEFQKGLEALSVIYNTNNNSYDIIKMQPAGIYSVFSKRCHHVFESNDG